MMLRGVICAVTEFMIRVLHSRGKIGIHNVAALIMCVTTSWSLWRMLLGSNPGYACDAISVVTELMVDVAMTKFWLCMRSTTMPRVCRIAAPAFTRRACVALLKAGTTSNHELCHHFDDGVAPLKARVSSSDDVSGFAHTVPPAPYGARFWPKSALDDVIGSHASSLQRAACDQWHFLSGGDFLTGSYCKLCPNTEGPLLLHSMWTWCIQ
jgi:hypothetical protein